jgi:predicted ATPase
MIERIIIENFKSIRRCDLELKPINILVGANGAGKSNFISFFYLLKAISPYLPQIMHEPRIAEIPIIVDKILYFGRKRSSFMKGEVYFDGYVNGFTITSVENSPFSYIDKNYLFEKSDEFFNKNLEDVSVQTIIENIQQFRIYHFHDTRSDSSLKTINALNDNRFLREKGENLAAFLYYLQQKHPQSFQRIENQIRSVAPFFDRFDLEPDRLNEKQIELRWLEKGSDAYFNAYDLSDGTLRFIALTTLLMQAELPKTIIIDEPELGLHPFAINKLAAMIKRAAAQGSQIIVSTQSVGLIDNFEPEDIITVDREDDQSVFRRLNSEDLKEWLDDYTLGELWNKNVIGARP